MGCTGPALHDQASDYHQRALDLAHAINVSQDEACALAGPVRLEAEGRLRLAKNPGYMPQRLHPVTGPDPNPLTRALLEERESER
jgi:hypothetical protein